MVLAALDTTDGPPPCDKDGKCNLAVCDHDPDCPAGLPKDKDGSDAEPGDDEHHPDSALGGVIDCDSTQSKDIRAVAWNIVDDWGNFEYSVESQTDIQLGNCIRDRFFRNGKVECVSEYDCNARGCKLAVAPGLRKRIRIFQTFFDNIANLPQPDRRACYAGLMTHEFSHSCERYSDAAQSAAELREDAAFNYWKGRFAVSSTLVPNPDPNNSSVPNCGFD